MRETRPGPTWYPAGLTALSDDGRPPAPPAIDPSRLLQEMLDGCGLDLGVLEEPDARWQVRGGYMVAHGRGDIDHAASPLHSRSRPDAFELAPGYVSVDTGKYSLGPLMAARGCRGTWRGVRGALLEWLRGEASGGHCQASSPHGTMPG